MRTSILFIKENLGEELIGAEVGVFRGLNARSILTLPIKKLYLIDPYVPYDENDTSSKNICGAFNIAKKKLSGSKDKIIWVLKSSFEAVNEIPNDLDFVYIDANHNYEFVKEDMENYYGKVRDGGILAGHDIHFEGVSQAVIEFANERRLEAHIHFPDWWIVKKGIKNET